MNMNIVDIITEEAKRLFSDSFYAEQNNHQIQEVGEGDKHKPYAWRESAPVKGNYEYLFQTQDGDDYEVQMQDIGNYWNIDFKTRKGRFEDVINKGRFFQVMATLADVISDFLIKEDPQLIRISPAKNSNADQRRFNIYKQYFEKQLPDGYDIYPSGEFIFVEKIMEENHEGMGINSIIREEIMQYEYQNHQKILQELEGIKTYSIPQLAQILADNKQQYQNAVPILQQMLFDEYEKNGDAGVEKMYAKMSGVQVEAITRGRYVFGRTGGGGEPRLEEIEDNANHMPDEMPYSF